MRANHVWNYDFVSARTHDGRSVRILNLIDEHTRKPAGACGTALVLSLSHLRSGRRDGAEGRAGALDRIMGPSSSRKTYANGSRRQEQRRCTSSLDLRGRTATARASTPSSGTSSSTVRSSTRSKNCACWPNAGASTTTRSDHTRRWAIDHRHPRHG